MRYHASHSGSRVNTATDDLVLMYQMNGFMHKCRS